MTFFEEISSSNTNVSVDICSSLPQPLIFIGIKTGNLRRSAFTHCNGMTVNDGKYDFVIYASVLFHFK